MAKYQHAKQERVREYRRAKRERVHESRLLSGLESFESQKTTPKRAKALRNAAVKRWRKRHPDRVAAINKEKFNRIRMEVIYRYSFGTMSCACCGWDRVGTANSLEIDHVGGGGSYLARKSRDARARGIGYLYDLRNNFQPEKYRVLCRACNAIIEPNKPHCVLHEPTP